MKKYIVLAAVCAAAAVMLFSCGRPGQQQQHYDVAAFVWPAYHNDPRMAEIGVFPDGVGEWEAVYKAKPKFEGHRQPNIPLWGYLDEADPKVQEKKIETALGYGVNVFIFDWYWYDGRPFLENALNEGFLKARNNRDMKFYLMWANHVMTSYLDPANPDKNHAYWTQPVDAAVFDEMTDHVIEDYFKQPNYYRIDGKPVFSIYETATFIREMGGEAEAVAALDRFREKCVAAGLPGVHIQPILWFLLPPTLSDTPGDSLPTQQKTIDKFGFESLTNYQWCHLIPSDRPYREWGEAASAYYERFGGEFTVPYFPHVSIGWDPNPRYPEGVQPCVTGANPEDFEYFLRRAKDYIDSRPGQPPLVTVNAWNEWAEGSYLEPDALYGYQYLEAVKRVFGSGN